MSIDSKSAISKMVLMVAMTESASADSLISKSAKLSANQQSYQHLISGSAKYR